VQYVQQVASGNDKEDKDQDEEDVELASESAADEPQVHLHIHIYSFFHAHLNHQLQQGSSKKQPKCQPEDTHKKLPQIVHAVVSMLSEE